MKAIQATELGKASIVEVPEPELSPDSILVRPNYVGNNPCDWFCTDFDVMFKKGQVVGCDYAGTVEKIGSSVKTSLKPGDKVFGAVAAGVGCDLSRGAFAELIEAYGDFCFLTPKAMDEKAAATLGVAMATVCISFYGNLGIPMPKDDPRFGEGKPFFVHAGSTTTGLMAIQFLKLSGFRVITTCSPKNFDLVKSRGADEVYDYHDEEKCIQQIKSSVGDDLQYAYCCYMGDAGPKICDQTISSKGGKFGTIVGGACSRNDIESTMIYGEALMCDPYICQTGIARQTPDEKALNTKFWPWVLTLLENGTIVPPPLEVREGLEGALSVMDDLRGGKVSGLKIVNRMG